MTFKDNAAVFGRSLFTSMWKIWILHRRHYIATILELLLPLSLSCLLVYLATLFEHGFSAGGIQQKNATTYSPFKPELPYRYSRKFLYTPDTALAKELLTTAFEQSNGIELVGATSENDIEEKATSNETNIIGAAVFSGFHGNDLPSVLNYKLRLANEFYFDPTDETYLDTPPQMSEWMLQTTTPYESSGFLGMQSVIDLAYIKMRQKQEGLPVQDIELFVQRMPYPPHLYLRIVPTLQDIIPAFIICGFLLLCPIIAKRIIDEKTNRAKELMKMMGMSTVTYWGSTFLSNFAIMFVISMIITILYSIPFSNEITVLSQTSFTLFLVILLLYCASALLFCFVITTLFNKAAIAITVIVIAWVTTLTVGYTLAVDFSTPFTTKVLVCLIPNIAFTWAAKIMSINELSETGTQWNNLLTPPFESQDCFCMGTVILMMVVSCIIYTILLWYLDAVWPWQPGVPKSPIFCFMKSYWMPSNDSTDEFDLIESTKSEYFEDEPIGISPSIVISHLTKVFKMVGVKKNAVDDLSLNMYPGQITALLGHNGAGKTTTMNILTGIFPPTKGSALINGHDIVKSTDAARRSLGLCPQHNVLYDNLTVEEHLKFFAGLKGFPWSGMNNEITRLLEQFELQDKRNTLSKDLSGGMKRKLSLGIAVIGGSQVLILDEPTTGMDPEARRVIWDMLQSLRPGRTILLTTHYMEEADALGDRIAIMASGSVQCCGSAIFLKRKFGTGYHLRIEKGDNCEIEDITKIIQRHIPDAKLVRNMSLELTYSLLASTEHFSLLFEDLEKFSEELGIKSCGVNVTTMDDVFLKVGQMAEKDSEKPGIDESAMEECINEGIPLHSSTTPTSPLIQQIKALLMKRVNYAKRYLFVLIFQMLIPLIAFSLFVYLNITPSSSFSSRKEFSFDLSEKFTDIKYGFTNVEGNTLEANTAGRYYNSTLKSESVIVYGIENPEEFLLEKGTNDIKLYIKSYLIGGSITEKNNKLSVTAWYNGIHYHLSPMSINLMTNALLRYALKNNDSKISIVSHLLPVSEDRGMSLQRSDAASQIFNALFLPLGLTFLSSSFVLFPIHERVSKAKLLQRMCGVSGLTYWLMHFFWDFFIHFLCCVLLLIPLLVYHGINHFIASDAIGAIFLVLLLYGLSSIPFSYIISFIPNVSSTGFSILTILNSLTGIIITLVMSIIRFAGGFETGKFQLAMQILRLFPTFAVTWGINNIHILSKSNIKCLVYTKSELEEVCSGKNPQLYYNPMDCCTVEVLDGRGYQPLQYLEWKNNSAGKECLYLTLTAAFWFLITVLIETILPKIFNMLVSAIKSTLQKTTVDQMNAAVINLNEDNDVCNERQRIEQLFYRNIVNEEALVVSNLTKCFGSLYAVNDLTFGVHKEECFGLLGINGAGKTTTFRMLAGDLLPTHGNAYIGYSSIQSDIHQFQMMTGYCPQFDALIDRLNGREILHLFANLRGIPKSEISSNVNKMIEMCNLEQHADKPTKTYSGGTKRKLSLGMALIGAPPVVLLDEPTSGVDPTSRRKIWKTLVTMKKLLGTSFILTSHSMDECETLCNRVAIMVNGQFCCLGAMQSLKSKFGQGFSLVVKLSQSQSLDDSKVQEVKAYIERCFPCAALKVEHQGILNYHITDTSLKWGRMFAIMEEGKTKFELEDYILSDTTLEQIFLAFARAQKGL